MPITEILDDVRCPVCKASDKFFPIGGSFPIYEFYCQTCAITVVVRQKPNEEWEGVPEEEGG